MLRAIRQVLPSADVLYFGDIKNAPYGSRSQEELSTLTIKALKLLEKRGAGNFVSACNSVSASLALSVLDVFTEKEMQIIEMVGPTVSYFKDSNAKIILCATPATIRSGIYQNAFGMVEVPVTAVACQNLAGAIEFGTSREEIRGVIVESFKEYDLTRFEVLVLACTHYPLVMDIFTELYPNLFIFDPAIAVADRVEKKFWPQESGQGSTSFLISKDSEPFKAFVQRLFPRLQYSLEVVE